MAPYARGRCCRRRCDDSGRLAPTQPVQVSRHTWVGNGRFSRSLRTTNASARKGRGVVVLGEWRPGAAHPGRRWSLLGLPGTIRQANQRRSHHDGLCAKIHWGRCCRRQCVDETPNRHSRRAPFVGHARRGWPDTRGPCVHKRLGSKGPRRLLVYQSGSCSRVA